MMIKHVPAGVTRTCLEVVQSESRQAHHEFAERDEPLSSQQIEPEFLKTQHDIIVDIFPLHS